MNKELIIQNVEALVNGHSSFIKPELLTGSENAVERYMINTVRSLEIEYHRYCLGKSGISDYLGALRAFLISFQAKIHVYDARILENNDFGIYQDDEKRTWYAVADVPDCFKHPEFVESAFIKKETPSEKHKSKYLLQTNPFTLNRNYVYTEL